MGFTLKIASCQYVLEYWNGQKTSLGQFKIAGCPYPNIAMAKKQALVRLLIVIIIIIIIIISGPPLDSESLGLSM